MLNGAVASTFGVAITKSTLLSKWIGAVRIAVDVVTLAAGVVVAYVGFSSVRDPVADLSILIVPLDSNPGYFHVEKNKYKEGDRQIIY